MKIDSWQCDICGATKKVANHWFRAWKIWNQQGVIIQEWDAKPPLEEVENWEAHLCGADCATQWLSKNLL